MTTEEIRAVSVATATVWTGPDAPRALDAPALSAPSSVREWAARMTLAERLDLHGRVESQVLLGDQVIVLEERSGWTRVVVPSQPSSQNPRGYPGWLPSAQLIDEPSPPGADPVVVTVPTTTVYDRPDGRPLVSDVSFATVFVPVGRAEAGWLQVAVPGGTVPGWLPAGDVAAMPTDPPAAADLLATASQFLGLAYLWAGTCGLGLDCSGLVHTVLRRYGVTVPREADDQAAAVAVPVEPSEAVAGDLLFFARAGQPVHHVGICAGGGRMLHAPETGRGIACEPLSPERAGTLVSAGRVW